MAKKEQIPQASLPHDVGAIAISGGILRTPDPLDAEECAEGKKYAPRDREFVEKMTEIVDEEAFSEYAGSMSGIPRLFFLFLCLLPAACAGRNTGLALGIGPHGPGLALYTDNLLFAPPYAGAYMTFPESGRPSGRYERGGVAPDGGFSG